MDVGIVNIFDTFLDKTKAEEALRKEVNEFFKDKTSYFNLHPFLSDKERIWKDGYSLTFGSTAMRTMHPTLKL